MSSKNNNKFTASLSSPERRALAFLKDRMNHKELVQKNLRTINGNITDNQESRNSEVTQLAINRLEQLQIFRQKKRQELAQRNIGRLNPRDAINFTGNNWIPIGPAGITKGQAEDSPVVSGRTTGIGIVPGGQRIYIATANGGVWRSLDSGKSWKPMMDAEDNFPNPLTTISQGDSLACGSIAIVPGNTASEDVIFVGSGEFGNVFNIYGGVGPMVSTNGGQTWTRESASPSLVGGYFVGLAVDPDNPTICYGATNIGIYKREPSGGSFVWNRVGLNGSRVTGIRIAKKNGIKRFFAAVFGDKIYASVDGSNWVAQGSDFPTARVGRISITVHPHHPNIAYAQIAFGGGAPSPATNVNPKYGHLMGVYRIDINLDDKWYKINGIPDILFGPNRIAKSGQGNYDNAITIAPDNENRIFIAGSLQSHAGGWNATLYRCDIEVQVTGATVAINAMSTYLGGGVHPDVHTLVFVPNEPEKLWVGCDGGVFYTANANAVAPSNPIFVSKNHGIQTGLINHMALHPTQEEVLFCGVQDNGGLRYAGDKMWLHSAGGDGGYYVIDWDNPYRVVSTYIKNILRVNDKGGNRKGPPNYGYDYANAGDIPLTKDAGTVVESVKFYAPLAGTRPINRDDPDYAAKKYASKILAFGTDRPWISDDFGRSWQPIPSRNKNNLASHTSDKTIMGGQTLESLTFATSKILYAGSSGGRIVKYTDTSAGNDWTTIPTPTVIGNLGGSVTCIAMEPGSTTKLFVSIGGSGTANHVRYYDGSTWHNRSTGLINVHFNTIAIHPTTTSPNLTLYAGSDVGIWRSTDDGNNWITFSEGLPECPIIDIKIFKRTIAPGNDLVILRAATYGRGVFERILPPNNAANTQLYLRDTIIDRGRFPTLLDTPGTRITDPTNPSGHINTIDSPDIKIDTPDPNGAYKFNEGMEEYITPGQFKIDLTDKSQMVGVPTARTVVSKVYILVHNRSVVSINNVQVTLLMKEITGATIPDLPNDYHLDIVRGTAINRDDWKTIGIKMAHGLHVGNSQVVTIDLPSTFFPNHATIGASGKEYALAAILHHQTDAYTSAGRVLNIATVNNVLQSERKISIKRIKAVQFGGIVPDIEAPSPMLGFVDIPESATEPEAPLDGFLGMALRVNDDFIHENLLNSLASPFVNTMTDGNITDTANLGGRILHAKNINVNQNVTLEAATPLFWFASEKITIDATIDGKGKGTPADEDGDFGGSGGASDINHGKDCKIPIIGTRMALGGRSINPKDGNTIAVEWQSRMPLYWSHIKGGARGANDNTNSGGLGGGIVVLCAPAIEFIANGKIDVSGMNAPGNAGGGGGGVIMLIANEVIGLQQGGGTPNVIFKGGENAGSGGNGGNGYLKELKF